MKPLEIESWALRVVERVKSHLPIEDDKVEIKSQWPDPVRAQRRLGGHANAARGESILWVIGADEKKGVVGANPQELSSWLPSVQAGFDGIAPTMQNLNVTCSDKTIVALCFDTSRFPYVVKNPAFGKTEGDPVQFEVPWREGNRTRTATRNDLVTLLSPLAKMPKIEILDGRVKFYPPAGNSPPRIAFTVTIYVIPLDDTPTTFPFHKCTSKLATEGNVLFDDISLTMDTPRGKFKKNRVAIPINHQFAAAGVTVNTGGDNIEATRDEIVIRGAGKVEIDGTPMPVTETKWSGLDLSVTLVEAITESQVTLTAKFGNPMQQQGIHFWTLLGE